MLPHQNELFSYEWIHYDKISWTRRVNSSARNGFVEELTFRAKRATCGDLGRLDFFVEIKLSSTILLRSLAHLQTFHRKSYIKSIL